MNITLEEMKECKKDYAFSQKYGAHFIAASLIIWVFITIVNQMNLSMYYKNMLSLYSSAVLVPLALLFSKLFHIPFSQKEHPLNIAGLCFALNQILYLVLVILVWVIKPELMLGAYACVVGAHFLPYSWLYDSVTYRVVAIVIPVVAMAFTMNNLTYLIPVLMVVLDAVMLCIFLKNPKLKKVTVSS